MKILRNNGFADRLQVILPARFPWNSLPRWEGLIQLTGFNQSINRKSLSERSYYVWAEQTDPHKYLSTRFNNEICSYFSYSQLDCDLSHECLTPEADRLTLLCGARVMPDNSK